MQRSVWIGFDPREAVAFAVARHSVRRHTDASVRGLVLPDLMRRGLYTRPSRRADGRLFDCLSMRDDYDGAMSTEFALSRFLVPYLAGGGLALFIDCDMLALASLDPLFELAASNPQHAVTCVQHDYAPDASRKMDDQRQTRYARKNWSSMMVFNCDHPATRRLTPAVVNRQPGLWLHGMRWLADDEIGAVGEEWNFLVGHSQAASPRLVHFTEGGPWFPGFAAVPYAAAWFQELEMWARGDHSL